jgi:2-polyprenyl-3-methyl-5-hydroxy-6-metoxy-1,4-benzoquinol methylase
MKFDQPLPPGTILQYMYLKERLSFLKPGRFVEIGCGHGLITKILLQAGWSGTAYDLNQSALEVARQRNISFVENGRLVLKNQDWLQERESANIDLIISSLVLEHMDDDAERLYITKCKTSLNANGKAILFVPHSPKHWGIEDEIAGHYRRYTKESLAQHFESQELSCSHSATLTYPLSNWLLPLGDKLVRRAEKNKLSQTMLQRTVQSGHRSVSFKTSFPPLLRLVLNELSMLPFHVLQKANTDCADALILYGEFSAPAQAQRLRLSKEHSASASN